MNFKQVQYGKKVENNLVKSFYLAGIQYDQSPDLDHNYKIDFILTLNHQKYGIQFSLKNSTSKAINAKICALDAVPRFIYLCLANDYFENPDPEKARLLYNTLTYITKQYHQKALLVRMDMNGLMNITEL